MFNLKNALSVKKAHGLLAVGFVATMLFVTIGLSVGAQSFPEYQRYVHSYTNDAVLGNWTYVEKPLFPVYFNTSQIAIGKNWTIVCPLQASHTYHVYCYGAWVNTGSAPKTDYDIYVYNPKGALESMHTEAAGLPEHLGTTVDDPFFEPLESGNYTFVLVNDARESHGVQQATFMIMEHIECDQWYTQKVDGKNGSEAAFETNWAYEFITEVKRRELWVRVPDTLDMYEARLYLMNTPQSVSINNVSLPWELGLYGNMSTVGGYNLESEGYRGVAYASCEFNGQDMFLNYTASSEGPKIYHLVLMGEVGSGTVEFLIKTTFSGNLTALTSPMKVYPTNETVIAYAANSTALENATLLYTKNHWANKTSMAMAISNMTCNATIPRQEAGSFVEYEVRAVDMLKNNLTATGSFTVKNPSSITEFNSTRKKVVLGENITVTGWLEPPSANKSVSVQFMSVNDTKIVSCLTFENGTFTATYQPTTSGTLGVQASFAGSDTLYGCEGGMVVVKVEELSFLAANGLFIGGGVGGALAAVGVVVYLKKFRQ